MKALCLRRVDEAMPQRFACAEGNNGRRFWFRREARW